MAEYEVEKQPAVPEASRKRTESPHEARDRLLDTALLPTDSYHQDVYWADLPTKERRSWIHEQTFQEGKRELKVLGQMARANPFSLLTAYCSRYVADGMGLFVEGFVLFSIGNLMPLFAAAWPSCWGKAHTSCDKLWIDSVTYLEICGIIIGQVLVGIESDWIGRKFGLVQDAIVMLIGVVLLTSVWGTTLQGWVIGYSLSLFLYGIGVGGEYPLTASKTLESGQRGPAGTTDDRLHRGRNVVLAFLMQGWGQGTFSPLLASPLTLLAVFNQVVLMILLVAFNGGTEPPYSVKTAQLTYRVSFGIIAVLHAWLVWYRVFKVKYADAALQQTKKKQNTSGYDVHSLKLIGGHYWHRLVATAFGWFANDFFFYGNKIFASVFIQVIKPGASLFVTWEFNLLNIAVSLVGYYMAAFLIDHKMYGRKRMQQIGFFMDFLIYLFGAIFFDRLQQPGAPIKAFQFMYSAEVYPTSIRATAHGVSAAVGKLGALAPTILYNYIDNQTKFWVVPWFGLAAFIITFLFLPDTTGLDLREQERYWACVRAGRESDYHGVAIHPRHLSWWERVVLKRNRFYDPQLDKVSKIDELRVLYESHLIAQEDAAHHDDDHAFISPEVAEFFEQEGIQGRREKQSVKERKLSEAQPDKKLRSALEDTLDI